MAGAEQAFYKHINDIMSARYFHMQAAAGAWMALARAAGAESGALSGTASEAEAEEGVGLLELADRMTAVSGWAEGAGAVARQIADQLSRAGERSAQATERAVELDVEFSEVNAWEEERIKQIDVGMGVIRTNEVAEDRREMLRRQAEAELEALGEEFARVIGAEPPAAPEGGAGGDTFAAAASGGGGGGGSAVGGGAAVGGGGYAVAGGGGGGGAGAGGVVQPDYQAPNGSVIGSGEYPGSRVQGPEQGDFAGWVQSPNTGHLVDPATGREFDPVAGRWIDPVTGQPFGDVTEYATRLSGIGAGPGAVATTGGLAGLAAGGGAASLAGLYGGIMPPSVGHSGPARGQMVQQATRNLARRAQVASRFALHEAGQGGRPFVPPPGAAAGRGGAAGQRVGVGGRGVAQRSGVAFPAGQRTAGAAARALAPGPAGSAAGGRGQQATRGNAARAGSRARAVGEPAATWRSGGRDASARHGLTGRPGNTPPPSPGAKRSDRDSEERGKTGKPTDLTEDPAVWASNRNASNGVLGA
ncbi:hypothetical protein [Streptomyces millisiae]|uniref:PPE family domain-containing protein n=1 Tax=Streptomyces millisiae TaxID=3075542 RepID=A0ABU2LU76_9ACTN|nr:hypothetical protein [Streptomyces sp. DSM 44918]MDT0321158.1 hypothetical protein [Streptomyces sp. DSM 44918]